MRGSITSSRMRSNWFDAAAFEPALAVGTGLDRVAFASESIGERQDEARLVFDEQYAPHEQA